MTNSPTGCNPGSINKQSRGGKEYSPHEQTDCTFYGGTSFGDKEDDAAEDVTRDLIEKHISYICTCLGQKKAVPEECFRCCEHLIKEWEKPSSAKENDQRPPSPTATFTPRPYLQSRTPDCDDREHSDVSPSPKKSQESEPVSRSIEEPANNYDVVVTELCKEHKRFLKRSASTLKRLESKRRCDLCDLVKDAEQDTPAKDEDEGDHEAVTCGCGPSKCASLAGEEVRHEPFIGTDSNVKFSDEHEYYYSDECNKERSTLEESIQSRDARYTSIDSTGDVEPKVDNKMPRSRCDFEEEEAKRKEEATCTCVEKEQRAPVPPKPKNAVIQADKESSCRRAVGPAVEPIMVCVKCGGNVEETRPTSRDDCGPRRNASRMNAVSSNGSGKSILLQKNSNMGKQCPSKEKVKTYKCTCKLHSEDDDGVSESTTSCKPEAPSPPKCQETVEDILCRDCGGLVTEDDAFDVVCYAMTGSHGRTRSEEQMNEAIMKKREEVWGNNVPPGFIIEDTEYAKRHNECCVNNQDTDGIKYTCPNATIKITVTTDPKEENAEGANRCGSERAARERVSDEQVCCRPVQKTERNQRRNEPRANECISKSNGSRESIDSGKGRVGPQCKTEPPRRMPVSRSNTNTVRPKTSSSHRPEPRQSKECHPEIVVTTNDTGKIISFTCKAVHDDEESDVTDTEEGPEDECRIHGKKPKKGDSGWYEKINKQIRSYIDIDEDPDCEGVPRNRPAADDCIHHRPVTREVPVRRTESQRSAVTCVAAAPEPPRQCMGATRPSCGSKGDLARSKETQTSVSSIRSVGSCTEHNQIFTRETQTSKDTLGSPTPAQSPPKPIGLVHTLCVCPKMSRDDAAEKKDSKHVRSPRVSLRSDRSQDSVTSGRVQIGETNPSSPRVSQQRPISPQQRPMSPTVTVRQGPAEKRRDSGPDRFGEFPSDEDLPRK